MTFIRNSQEQDPQPRNQSGEGQNQQSYNKKGYHTENDSHRGKSGYYDRSYKRNNDSRGSSSNYSKKVERDTCHRCGEKGHWKQECKNKPLVKSVEVERDYYDEDESSLQLHSINLYATKVKTDFATNKSVMTKINMGTAGPMEFEMDTAASHSILSYASYMKLRNNSEGDIPRLKSESRNIRLADGTSSCKRLSSVSIRCKADNSDSKVLDFYVMNAPGNLLGRYAIEELWPKLFTEIKRVKECYSY